MPEASRDSAPPQPSYWKQYDLTEDDQPGLLDSDHHWSANVPGLALLLPMGLAWIWHVFWLGESMAGWGVSAADLGKGSFENLFLHMFAHAGVWHLLINGSVLYSLAGPLTARLGAGFDGWLRFLLLFFASGFSGAALFLLIHPHGSLPMIGASGAISGLLGVVTRLPDEGSELVPLTSQEMGRRVWSFVKANLLLILIISVPIFLMGKSGGIAWEAHLGGYLVGLLAAPKLLKLDGGELGEQL